MLEGVEQGIVALSVHDAVAVPQDNADWAKEAMLRAWFEHANSGGGIARSRVRVVSLMYKKRNQTIKYLHRYSNNQQSPKQTPAIITKPLCWLARDRD